MCLRSGGATVCFESVVLFTYFISLYKAQVFSPRPNANTGRCRPFCNETTTINFTVDTL
jgi:hypothetical protein